MIEKLIVFIFATAGLSWIITKSQLFKKPREYFTVKFQLHKSGLKHYVFYVLHNLTNCEACIGLWSGLLNYTLLYVLHFEIISYAFSGSIFSLLVISLNKYLSK